MCWNFWFVLWVWLDLFFVVVVVERRKNMMSKWMVLIGWFWLVGIVFGKEMERDFWNFCVLLFNRGREIFGERKLSDWERERERWRYWWIVKWEFNVVLEDMYDYDKMWGKIKEGNCWNDGFFYILLFMFFFIIININLWFCIFWIINFIFF